MTIPQSSRIDVELVLDSGATQTFEITEEILDELEYFRRAGLAPHELCRAWLAVPPRDSLLRLRVRGTRSDGTRVFVELDCDAPTSDEIEPARSGGG